MTYSRKRFLIVDPIELDQAETREILLLTTQRGPELKLQFECSGSADFELYEASELEDVELNRLTPLVVNRSDPHTPSFTVCHTPSAGADGNLLFKILAEGGYHEAITLQLKADTAYLIRSTSNAAANRICTTLTFTEWDGSCIPT